MAPYLILVDFDTNDFVLKAGSELVVSCIGLSNEMYSIFLYIA